RLRGVRVAVALLDDRHGALVGAGGGGDGVVEARALESVETVDRRLGERLLDLDVLDRARALFRSTRHGVEGRGAEARLTGVADRHVEAAGGLESVVTLGQGARRVRQLQVEGALDRRAAVGGGAQVADLAERFLHGQAVAVTGEPALEARQLP